jgi:purine nucleosidase
VCAVAYVARPDLFATKPARVDVETRGEFTTGMTVVDFNAEIPNALVATELDVSGFWAYVESVYARVAAEHSANASA